MSEVTQVETIESLSGFLCPACPGFVKLENEVQLAEHWASLHDQEDLEAAIQVRPKKEHTWEEVTFRKPRMCPVCSTMVWHYGHQCTVCRLTCHRKCSARIETSEEHRLCQGVRQKSNPLVKNIRKIVSGKKMRYVKDNFDLDLTYITPRLIAMSFPASGLESTYRNNLQDVAKFLKAKHGDYYMIFNVSEKSYDISKFNNQVLDFGWPDHLAPPLERLCSVCKSIDSWLNSDSRNVVAVHCKGGKGRTGVVIAAYMNYSRLFLRPEDAMQQFAIKRFTDGDPSEIGITQPSQRRYVHYFSEILEERLKLAEHPMLLQQVVMTGAIPNYDGRGGCRPVVKIYGANLTDEVWSSEPRAYSGSKDNAIVIHVGSAYGLVLQDDVLIKCFHRSTTGRDTLMFRCQFHTCAVTTASLTLDKSQLDEAWRDKKFLDHCAVTLRFGESMVGSSKKPGPRASGAADSSILSSSPSAAVGQVGVPRTLTESAVTLRRSASAGRNVAALPRTQTAAGGGPQHAKGPQLIPTTAGDVFIPRDRSSVASSFSDDDGGAAAAAALAAMGSGSSEELLSRTSSYFASLRVAEPGAGARPAAMEAVMPTAHQSEVWYYANTMSVAACERLLHEKAAPGEFVVRQDGEDTAAFVLSVNCGEEVQHFRTQWDRLAGAFVFDAPIGGRFPSLSAAIASYSLRPICVLPGGIPVKLLRGFGTNGLTTSYSAKKTLRKTSQIHRKSSTSSLDC